MSPHGSARVEILLKANLNILPPGLAGWLNRMKTRYMVIVKAIIPTHEMSVPDGKAVS